MAEQSGKGRRGPRKALAQLKAAAESAWASLVGGSNGEVGSGIAGAAAWRKVEPILLKIEAEHGMLGRVIVPFHGAPDTFVRASYGCPVVAGDHFTVVTCSGIVLDNPTL